MVLFTEIKCVQKDGSLVVGISGTVASSSSDGNPSEVTLRFIEGPQGVPSEDTLRIIDGRNGINKYLFPDGRKKLIRYLTMADKLCLFIEGDSTEQNFLDNFPECQDL